MRTPNIRCENCVFYEPLPAEVEPDMVRILGECRRDPPARAIIRDGEEQGGWSQPKVTADYWCGAYRAEWPKEDR